MPLVESPLFNMFFGSDGPNADISRIARDLNRNGYVVLQNFVPGLTALCDEIVESLKGEFDLTSWQENKKRGINVGLRIQDSFNRHECVRKLSAADAIIDLLSRMYGRAAYPFQTLNFPVGTEQHFHTDSIHFSSYPEKFMCGVWVALEDIGEEQGPLVFYPGSHKLPVYENIHYGIDNHRNGGVGTQERYHAAWQAIIDAMKIKPKYFHAKKGDMLIWCANLLHGGSTHTNTSMTRWSQVTHYYFDNCTYYTPMNSDTFLGKIALRTPINLTTRAPAENKFLGEPLPEDFARKAAAKKDISALIPDDFDPKRYIQLHADLRKSNIDGLMHYLKYGKKEGRRYK